MMHRPGAGATGRRVAAAPGGRARRGRAASLAAEATPIPPAGDHRRRRHRRADRGGGGDRLQSPLGVEEVVNGDQDVVTPLGQIDIARASPAARRDLRDGRPTTSADAITVAGDDRWFRLKGARPGPLVSRPWWCAPPSGTWYSTWAGVAVGTTLKVPPTPPVRDPRATVEAKVKAIRARRPRRRSECPRPVTSPSPGPFRLPRQRRPPCSAGERRRRCPVPVRRSCVMASRDHDLVDEFLMVVDQLEVCRTLLREGNPVRGRMALILLDNLADILLHRRCRDILAVTPHLLGGTRQLRTAKDLRWFHDRLAFVREPQWVTSGSGKAPFLAAGDAAVLLVAHRYRNAAYHQDDHNPATITTLATILFKTVAQMWSRLSAGHWSLGVYGPQMAEQLAPLDRYGAVEQGGFRGSSGIHWGNASTRIAADLSDGLEVALPDAVSVFCADIEDRLDELAGMIESEVGAASLREVDGQLAWKEFLDKADGDKEIRRLRKLRAAPIRERLSGQWSAPTADEIEVDEQCRRAIWARMMELWPSFTPTATTALLDERLGILAALAGSASEADLLERYEGFDRRLADVEDYVELLRREWEIAVQAEIDWERGK